MAKVSIIVPVYNTAKYLERCLDSLVDQTYKDFEIILVDDKSTDKSLDILERYRENYPDKIVLLENPVNMGIGATRNRGLSVASGEYVGFVDSDDRVSLDMYKKLTEALEETRSSIARGNRIIVFHGINVSFFGRGTNIDSRMIINPKKEVKFLSTESPVVWNKLFRRELIGDRKFPTDINVEDYPFCIPLLYKADQIVTVPETLYYYSMNPSGASISNMRKKPNVLDTFRASDIIKEEIVTPGVSREIAQEVNIIAIQNCMQRCRDVLYSTSISLEDKKELLALMTSLITIKYGSWCNNPEYESRKKTTLYKVRRKIMDRLIEKNYEGMEPSEIEERIRQYTKRK